MLIEKEKTQGAHAHAGVTTMPVTNCTHLSLALESLETFQFDIPAISGFLSVVVREAPSAGASRLLACGQQVFEGNVCLGDTSVDIMHVDVSCAEEHKRRIDLGGMVSARFAALRLYKLVPGVHPASYAGLPLYTADVVLSRHEPIPEVNMDDAAGVMAVHVSWPGLTLLSAQAESALSSRQEEGIEIEANMEELGQLFDQGALFPVWGLPETTCRVVVLPPDWKGQWSAFGCRVLEPVHYRLSHPSDTLALHVGPRLSLAPEVSWRGGSHSLIHSLSVSAYVAGMLVCTVLIRLHGLTIQQASTNTEAITQFDPMARYADACPGWRSGVDPLSFV
ncbi:hypothetical protein [Archangium sp.]|uniref:hypothetical protein n=1 Tax=Archangium sp. TaxID=1872627 RepID=UPI002D763DED|nr:hypothetical protein [Archangium sp.]HYO53044.1 hypothetical protein [Archangium sp.]